jgi:hypothetical protein
MSNSFLNALRREFDLPEKIRDFLETCPYRGGTHDWIWEGALRLRAHKSIEDAIDLLVDATRHCEHSHRREIIDAVQNAYRSAYFYSPQAIRPSADPDLIQRALAAPVTVAELESRSQNLCDDILTAEYYIGALFPPDSLVCAGRAGDDFLTQRYRRWCESADNLSSCAFVVPSPMTGVFGMTKDGRRTQRSDDNTSARMYAVLEWDFPVPAKGGLNTFDCCTTLIARVAERYPLSMAVSSGSKSVHGWWRCQHWSPERLLEFWNYGRVLGCDPHLETLSQFTRMPSGCNGKTGQIQSVLYLDLSQ